MLGGGSLTFGDAWHNLLYSTAGNVVGGVLLVGLPFTYLNPREREEQGSSASRAQADPQP
jgi:formate/nitrite transporter FocA (FNT family)